MSASRSSEYCGAIRRSIASRANSPWASLEFFSPRDVILFLVLFPDIHDIEAYALSYFI
jgi:hypothetical protein